MHRLLLVAFATASVTFAQAVTSAAQAVTSEEARKFLEVTNALSSLDQIFEQSAVEAQIRTALKPESAPPDRRAAAERFVKEFAVEFSGEARKKREELMAIMEGIVVKHYTQEDMKGLLAFYQTPVGKKMLAMGPKVAMESMQAGQAWGQKLGQEIGQRVGQRIEAEEAAKKKQ